MSERGFRKLLKRYREKGDAAVVHGLRGCVSNRRLDEETAQEAMAAIERRYRDFRPTLAAEYLARETGIRISRETVRKLMMRAGIWRASPRKLQEVHMWRPRRSCRGELVQWDTSVHAWLEDRGPDKMYLVALIDDATSTLFARFVPADSTEHHMRVLWGYLERYGRPQAVYTDKASLFQPSLAPNWQNEEPGPKNETQMGRALRELGIEWIAAHSPQAKGRIERSFSTLQDRLVKGLRMAGATTIEESNRYLDEVFLPEWKERFTVKAESAIDAHRPIGDWLCVESILSHVEPRQVHNDYTVAWAGRHWQIPRAALRPGLRGSSIRVEARLDGTLQARIGDSFAQLSECERPARLAPKPKRSSKRYVPGPGESRWMDGFSVKRPSARQAAGAPIEANEAACGSKESCPPFPFPPGGKPGRAGSPHAAQSAAPPTRGLSPPCASPGSTLTTTGSD
jgi:transposase